MKTRLILALVALLAFAGAPPARANWIFYPPGWIEQRGTLDGAAYTTELFPMTEQTSSVVIVSATSLDDFTLSATSANAATGTGLTPFPSAASYAHKEVRVLVTGAPTNSPPWTVRFWQSGDGVAYAPVMRRVPAVGGFAGSSDDTLKIRGRGALTQNGQWYPLVGDNGAALTGNYITAVCSADSTVSTNYIFTVEIRGRKR
jgi:hypothetical protein